MNDILTSVCRSNQTSKLHRKCSTNHLTTHTAQTPNTRKVKPAHRLCLVSNNRTHPVSLSSPVKTCNTSSLVPRFSRTRISCLVSKL